MTKEKLRRYFELEFEKQEIGRLDREGSQQTPRYNEWVDLTLEFEAWEPGPEDFRGYSATSEEDWISAIQICRRINDLAFQAITEGWECPHEVLVAAGMLREVSRIALQAAALLDPPYPEETTPTAVNN